MSFALYLFGFALVTGGIAWALVIAGVATHYILIVCLVLIGIGVLTGVTRTRLKDSP